MKWLVRMLKVGRIAGRGGGGVEQGTDIESRGFSSPQTLEAHVWITNL